MSRRRQEPRWLGIAATLIVSLTALTASAQPVAIPPPMPKPWPPGLPGPVDRTPSKVGFAIPGHGLRERLGVEVARQLFLSDDPKERMRGVERLGSIGDAPAIDALLEAIDSGSPASRDPDARLHGIRMLAPHATETRVRALLARELLGGAGGKTSLVRSTAAMALALAGDQKALETLALAIDQRGPASEAARVALLSYPPATLDPFLFEPADDADDDKTKSATEDDDAVMRAMASRARAEGDTKKKKPRGDKPEASSDDDDTGDDGDTKKKAHTRRARTLSTPMVDFFAELGDLRALPALRTAAARKQIVVKTRAGLALARFGDPTGLADARELAKGDDPRVQPTATETLVVLGDSQAPAALTKLLVLPSTRSLGLDLLFGSANPALFRSVHKELETLAKEEQGPERSRVVMALARVAPANAAALLDGPKETREAAAYALAISPEPEAGRLIEAKLSAQSSGAGRRLIVRAAIVRSVVLGSAPAGLDSALEKMGASKDDADRETAALGLVATGTSAQAVMAKARIGSRGPPTSVVAGAARGALLGKTSDLAAFLPLLIEADADDTACAASKPARSASPGCSEADATANADDLRPTLRQIAAGVALLDADSAKDVPQKTLLAWAEGGGPLAPLAARALGARDDETIRSRLEELLHGTDPTIRASVALGLAHDPEPSSASLLTRAYLTDEDATVRKACIRALGERSETQRTRILEWASALDPDSGVRGTARLALQGRTLREGDAPLGSTLSFTHVARTDGTATMTAARFSGADGLPIPVVSAADGVLLLPLPAFGPASLNASPSAARDAPSVPTSKP